MQKIFDFEKVLAICRDIHKDECSSDFATTPSKNYTYEYKAAIKLLRQDARQGCRPPLFGNDQHIKMLDEEVSASPNMERIINILKQRVALSKISNKSIDIPPLLLNGAPGVGKTRFAKRVADIIGTTSRIIATNTLTAASLLSGHGEAWRLPVPGIVSTELLKATTASPLIVMDEIDKPANRHYNGNDLHHILHSFFEQENASSFVDEYYDIAFYCQSIIWICTSNDSSLIPASLLDRMVVINVTPLTVSQKHAIIRKMFKANLSEEAARNFIIDDDAIDILAKYNMRMAEKLLKNAIGQLVLEGSYKLCAQHVLKSAHDLGEPNDKKFGFI